MVWNFQKNLMRVALFERRSRIRLLNINTCYVEVWACSRTIEHKKTYSSDNSFWFIELF